MPLYEYECEGGHRFEELRSMEDGQNAVCPVCSSGAKRRMSTFSFGFSQPFTTYGHDGQVIGQKQSTEQTPMLPEKVHGGRF